MINTIFNEDCLTGMNRINDKSIDLILCDLPYGTTKNKWDSIIPLDDLWSQYERVIKDNGAIILTASQPFTSKLVMSSINLFRHEWIWEKQKAANFMQTKYAPLKYHESVLVFYKQKPVYNPQKYKVIELDDILQYDKQEMLTFMTNKQYDFYGKIDRRKTVNNPKTNKQHLGSEVIRYRKVDDGFRFPKSVLKINKEVNSNIHPTQKPVSLFEYLIKTYSNEGDVVLDTCMGSGTTAIACINTKRNYIGFEIDEVYFNKSLERIKQHKEA